MANVQIDLLGLGDRSKRHALLLEAADQRDRLLFLGDLDQLPIVAGTEPEGNFTPEIALGVQDIEARLDLGPAM